MTTTEQPNEVTTEEFAGRLLDLYGGSMLTYMIDLGHRTGLLNVVAQRPGTSTEIAAAADLEERYVREWLAAMVTGGIVDYDPTTRTYLLPAAHAACLTDGPMNMAPWAAMTTHLGKHVHQVARAFKEGGGVPYAEYRPEFTDVMDAASRVVFDELLVDQYLPLVPGLAERLTAGARVADVACGTGHALVVLARAFPASTFVGYDLDEGAIARGRAEARGAGLANVRVQVCDAARLEADEPFDVVFVFDAIHDQVDPTGVLGRIHAALRAGGTFVMTEPAGADDLEENLGNPMAPILYATSTLHCLTVSLAHGGAGIGTVFGERLARRMLADAGFAGVERHPAPGDPMNAVYVTTKP
jgi:SAM-dependent methyltransferase